MRNLDLEQNISGAFAPGREHSFAPWNINCNTSFNSERVQKVKSGQSGRSMIEMLGVLAIIGVLSVGGIAGYSKAMQKYRINKTIEQITIIAGNVRSFFAPQKSYEGLNKNGTYNVAVIKKAKLVPDEMWDGNVLKSVFGQPVNIFTAHKSTNTDMQAFFIKYQFDRDYDVCIELMSHDWTNAGVTGIYASTVAPSVSAGNKTVPVSLDDAASACSAAINTASQYNGMPITLTFYFDVNSNCWNETNGNTCS